MRSREPAIDQVADIAVEKHDLVIATHGRSFYVLGRLVGMGDARPSDQDYAVLRELSARLDEILDRLDRFVATDLKQLNDPLAARNLKNYRCQATPRKSR